MGRTKTWKNKKRRRPKSTAIERMEFVEQQWRRDINIPINGNDGMQQRLSEVYGVTARDEQLIAIRRRIMEERADEEKRQRERRNRMKSQPVAPLTQPLFDAADFRPPTKREQEKMTNVTPIRNAVNRPMVPGPGTTASAKDSAIRYDYAREFIRRNPDAKNRDVLAALREEFGKGIDGTSIGNIRRELGVGTVKRRHNEMRAPSPPKKKHKPTPQRVKVNGEAASCVKDAIAMLLEEVPNLRSLELEVDADGNRRVKYEVAAVHQHEVEI